MKKRVSELDGVELDKLVARAEGFELERNGPAGYWMMPIDRGNYDGYEWSPSKRWQDAGPIIEREGIAIQSSLSYTIPVAAEVQWEANGPKGWFDPEQGNWGHRTTNGRTPLIAAMRCYVASKFGEEVEV